MPSFNYVCLHVISSHCMSSVHGSGVFVCGGFERGLLLAMTFFENLIPPPTSQSSIFVYNSKPSQLTFLGLAYLRAIGELCNPSDRATCPTLARGCELAIGMCYVKLVILLTETLWPSGLRRWLKAPFRKGVGSNPTGVTFAACDVTICACTCA